MHALQLLNPKVFFFSFSFLFFTVLLCNCAPQNKKDDVLAVPITRFLFSCLVQGALAPTALSVKGVATKEFEKAYFVPNDGEIFFFFLSHNNTLLSPAVLRLPG